MLVPYRDPVDLSTPEGRRQRAEPVESLADSYLRQRHSWHDGERLVAVRLVEQAQLPPPVESESIVLLTGWNPLAQPSTLEENLRRNRRLARDVARRGGIVLGEVATTAHDRSWLEVALRIGGLGDPAVRELAIAYGQAAYTRIGEDRVRIQASGLVELPSMVGWAERSTTPPSTCPMRRDDLEARRCAMRGGPWVSASIHAASIWKAHRALLITHLGCQPCADGRQPTLGPLGRTVGPVPTPGSRLVLASRYGGYAWR
jgi:hypothetical protein